MTISRETKRRQREWAMTRGIDVDSNGYVHDESQNFFQRLSPKFSEALDGAGGGERKKQRNRPAKIRALHSSAVLAINVFQYWEGRGGRELPRALGFDGTLESIGIERQYSSRLRGTPPTLDVVLSLAGGRLIAIESKFTEWMAKKRPKLDEFRAKYLESGCSLWEELGLPKCQRLAAAIAGGKEKFRHLDAGQLLKHALGLMNNVANEFSLLYLYYDYERTASIATTHGEEIDRFRNNVDEALDFRAMSYQQLFSSLSAVDTVSTAYLEYLGTRYFSVA